MFVPFAPAAITAVLVHVTVWPAALQVQPLIVSGLVKFGVMPVGSVSTTVIVPLVAAVPLLPGVSVYVAPAWPTVHGPLLVLLSVTCTEVTGVLVVPVQCVATAPVTGQVGSPPPRTVALFTIGLVAAAVGVTRITKLVVPPAARPAAIVHVTVCPAAVQPVGSVTIVRPAGIVSVIVAVAVVTVPEFCTCSV